MSHETKPQNLREFVLEKYANFCTFITETSWLRFEHSPPDFDIFCAALSLFIPTDLIEDVVQRETPEPGEVIPDDLRAKAVPFLGSLEGFVRVDIDDADWADVHKLCRYLRLFWHYYKGADF